MRINFDFTDLEAFLAVKDTGSFHVAADRLNLSQSSVTRRIKKLEQALGTSLFDRSTRDVRPTLAGKRLQQRAEAILQDAVETTQALRDETAAFAHQRAQTLVVATVPTLVTGLLAPAIKAAQAAGWRARVRLMDLGANAVAEAVAQGEADLGLGAIPLLEPTTEFTPLLSDPIQLAVPVGHALADRRAADLPPGASAPLYLPDPTSSDPTGADLTWADLAGQVLILPARGTGNRLMIDEALAGTGVPLAWSYEVERTSTALDLVAAGLGVAPVPRATAQGRTAVVWKSIGAPDVTRPVGLLRRIGQSDGSAAQGLVRALQARAKSLTEPTQP